MILKFLVAMLPLNLSAIDLGSVDVTSNQSIQEKMHTVSIVNESTLQTHKVDNIGELSTLIPNLNISGIWSRSNKTFSLRGVSNYVNYESSVAIYVDGVPLPFSFAYGLLDMKNITLVEFSKGASDALFGKGAESGVMRLTTQSPSKSSQAKLSFEAGSYNHKAMSGYFRGATPLEYLNYSLSFTKESLDGYSTNSLTGNKFDTQDMYTITAKLHYNPSNNLDIALSYAKLKSDDGGTPFSMNSKEGIRHIDDELMDEYNRLESDRLGLVLNYRWGQYALKSTISYVKQQMDKSDYVPLLGGLSLFLDTTIEEFTQDFQLKRSFEDSDLTLGVFYSKKSGFEYNENQILWNLYPMALESKNSVEYPDETVALSAKYNYYVDDKFIFSAGFRYQESKREFDRTLNNFGVAPTQANTSDRWKKFLPLLSLSYIADDYTRFYFSYSKGMRLGGYNYRSDDSLPPYKAQITDSYELGYKRDFDNGLKLNSTLFYNDIKDMRVVTFEDTLATFLTNAPKAYSYGFELDINYQQDNLLLYGSLGLTKAKYDKLIIDGVDYSGNNIIDTPNATASLGLQYDFSKAFYFNASLSYMGKRYYNASNHALEDGYSVSNLSLGYKQNGWEVELYGKNIFDREYVDFMIPTPSNHYYHFGTPQVVGVKVSKGF